MNKILILLALLVASSVTAEAQRFGNGAYARKKHYFDFSLGMGYHTMSFDPEEGDNNGRVGATAGAYYRRVMTPKLHLMTGIGASLYSARTKFSNLESSTDYVDPETGESGEFTVAFKNWEEVQRTIYLEIPIGAFYIRKLTFPWQLKAGGGFKLEMPVMKKFKTDNPPNGSMTKSVYFESTNVDYENLPQHGLNKVSEATGKADASGVGVSIFIEGGAIFEPKYMKGKSLYWGVYFSRSFCSPLGDAASKLFDPKSDSYNGVVSSDLVDKTAMMAIGVRVAYTISR